jgi:hypothetical protein
MGLSWAALSGDAVVVRSAPAGEAPGERLLVLPYRTGETFELRYIHSLNRFNVHELLRFAPDGSLVVETQYVDGSGAGIGEVPGEAVFVDAGGGWRRLEGLERRIDAPVVVRVGTVADHRIVVRGREFALLEVAGGGSRVTVGRERLGPFHRLAASRTLRAGRTAPGWGNG